MKKKLLLFYLLACLFTACRLPTYRPTAIEIPFISKKGDLSLNGAASFAGGTASGIATLSNNLLLTGSVFNLKRSFADTLTFEEQDLKGRGFALGIGYYKLLSKGKNHTTTFSCIAGYGAGKYRHDFQNVNLTWYRNNVLGANIETASGYREHGYTKFYVQPNYTILINDIVNFGFGARYNYLKFNYLDNYNSAWSALNQTTTQDAHAVDIGFTTQLGYKYVKCYGQAGASLLINKSNNVVFNNYQPFILELGLSFNFNLLNKKKIK